MGSSFQDGAAILGRNSDDFAFGAVMMADDPAPVIPTRAVWLRANLDSGEASVGAPFDPVNPSGTSSFTASVSLVGLAGEVHRVDLYFANAGGGHWEAFALGQARPEVDPVLGHGTLSFNDDGTLVALDFPPLVSPWRSTAFPTWVLDLRGVSSLPAASHVNSIHDNSQPASPPTERVLTSAGELVTRYRDGRQRSSGFILDGIQARVVSSP